MFVTLNHYRTPNGKSRLYATTQRKAKRFVIIMSPWEWCEVL